ncbi:MAG: cytochrome c oxidase subunit II [Chroococcidiopsidaceae cyanobacterium CP_BM_RX_35]|nr:cytochrome c oxidase subunit II [Chroococcidiopsidaceae cyanobacterium CP_BM_RX_35]
MKRILNTLLLAAFVTVIVIVSYWLGQQAYSWMPAQGTAEAKRVDALFSFLVTLGTFVFLGIAGFIMYSILTCRVGEGDFSDARPDRGNPKLEALWTGIPILLVLWIAAQNFSIYQQIDIQGLTPIVHLHIPSAAEPADAATAVNNNAKPVSEQIEVVAKQWSWTFRYPARNVTSTELHLPVNQSASLAMRSEDVIHGFYVPEFRLKQDIVPNRTITFTVTPLRKGKYRLHDSHFSGTYFAVMAADVYVESPEAYTQWLAQAATRKPAPAKNQAATEYARRQEYGFKSSWPSVRPAKPPVVNYSS